MTMPAAPSIPLRYRAYGLTLASDVPLPELPPPLRASGDDVDIHVSLGQSEPFPKPTGPFRLRRNASGQAWLSWAKTEPGYLLRFSHLATFHLDRSGHTVAGRPRAASTDSTLRHLLLDQVLPLALTLHGQQALHATAVLTPAGVCAFAGPAGTGKSTLAASFHCAGIPAISDDCLVLEPESDRIYARPAYPGVRLWDDSLKALGAARGQALPVAHYMSKRRPVLNGHHIPFSSGRRPLAGIYLLHRHTGRPAGRKNAPSDMRIVPLSQQEAFHALLPSSFLLDSTDRAGLRRQFQWLQQVVSAVPVRRLHLSSGFRALRSIRAMILADLGSPLP